MLQTCLIATNCCKCEGEDRLGSSFENDLLTPECTPLAPPAPDDDPSGLNPPADPREEQGSKWC